MAVKYFCDRCGKEAKKLYSITAYSSYKSVMFAEVSVAYRKGLCKKCYSEILKNVVKAIKG